MCILEKRIFLPIVFFDIRCICDGVPRIGDKLQMMFIIEVMLTKSFLGVFYGNLFQFHDYRKTVLFYRLNYHVFDEICGALPPQVRDPHGHGRR
jgi:hypothetical protein